MKIRVEKDILVTRLDGEIVLLNQKNGRYFILNTTGSRIWELLQEHEETEKAFISILDEYNVEKSTLQNDFNNLILKLTDAELVKCL